MFYKNGRNTGGFDHEAPGIDFRRCYLAGIAWQEVVCGMKGTWWYEFCEVVDPHSMQPKKDQTDGAGNPFGVPQASSQAAPPAPSQTQTGAVEPTVPMPLSLA